MDDRRYEELTPIELAEARARASLAYVPIGSTEFHGPHLPVGFDALHAQAVCLAAVEQTGGVVLPPTFWGTRGHEGYPGSLLLQEETIAALATDILGRLAQQGYRLIVLFTGHWPEVQGGLLKRVAQEHMGRGDGARVIVLDPLTIHPTEARTEHAGRIETSVMLHLRPDLVHMERLEAPDALKAITADCVDATAEYGKAWFEAVVEETVRRVKEAL
ncbi:MAG: creatininase family protein [Armatimonadetes bacterium]|nr:creatininase family protein [Armatimonadota bacterium]